VRRKRGRKEKDRCKIYRRAEKEIQTRVDTTIKEDKRENVKKEKERKTGERRGGLENEVIKQ